MCAAHGPLGRAIAQSIEEIQTTARGENHEVRSPRGFEL
jgi:hypothetical protein